MKLRRLLYVAVPTRRGRIARLARVEMGAFRESELVVGVVTQILSIALEGRSKLPHGKWGEECMRLHAAYILHWNAL